MEMADSDPNQSSDLEFVTMPPPDGGDAHRRSRTLRFSSRSPSRRSASSFRIRKQSPKLQPEDGQTSPLSPPGKDRSSRKRRGSHRRRQRTYPPSEPSYSGFGRQSASFRSGSIPGIPSGSYFPQFPTSSVPYSISPGGPYYWPPLSSFPQPATIGPSFEPTARSDQAQRRVGTVNGQGYLADASDEQKSKVHHVINISPQPIHGEDDGGSIKNRFPRHPTFNYHENKPASEKYEIIQTRLVPAPEDGTSDVAILTFDDETVLPQSEIRWIHLQSDSMSLKSLEIEALRLKDIPDATSALIFSLFKRLEHYERPYVHGKYLEPTALTFVGESNHNEENESTEEYSVAFLSFPYLSLEPLHPRRDSDVATIHPVRSLLQFHYSFESTEWRDTNQIVCAARESLEALHVPQIWMLLINGGLILSMGPTGIEGLQGDHIVLEKALRSRSAAGGFQIRLVDLEEKQYCLPMGECETWFEFIKVFAGALGSESPMYKPFLENSWKEEYDLLLDNEPVSEKNWPEVVRQGEQGDIVIRIIPKQHDPSQQALADAQRLIIQIPPPVLPAYPPELGATAQTGNLQVEYTLPPPPLLARLQLQTRNADPPASSFSIRNVRGTFSRRPHSMPGYPYTSTASPHGERDTLPMAHLSSPRSNPTLRNPRAYSQNISFAASGEPTALNMVG
ncbi:Mg2+ transporter protein CorA-like/Zinc transport protein ZntB [Penicillium hispanicum]|uniref:Mg2+ transporter protein CorA-like/Zinc transport protein ZntB n=1 Tax=Penicillium hispanicum TaxID=1080232 RepID=UPI0025407AFB|nr:Mg2+ transporter protein CorA-like/Zinc transport protein ZntB [Penicillium hispanicum]KAJ5578157.1 Mg2+ transporter protein CorA-like/Zinc transport protein ZntB [Penicillium hispanicum]